MAQEIEYLTPMLIKDNKHDHYWIEDGGFYESYRTIRGLRYRFLFDVDLPDTEKCSDDMLKFIEAEYTD